PRKANPAPLKTPASTDSPPPPSPSSASKNSTRSPASATTSSPSIGPSIPRSSSPSSALPSPNMPSSASNASTTAWPTPASMRPSTATAAPCISPHLVNEDNEITLAQNRIYLFAEGFHRLNKYSNRFTLFLRYQAQTERLYRRAIEDFNRLKALRHELPNEPILDTQPEANETVNPPEPDPPNPSPAGNISGQPKRFRPNGEPLRISPQPDPDPD